MIPRTGGIVSLPCGGGKTALSIYIMSVIHRKTLVVAHKNFLLTQWRKSINKFMPGARIGLIKGQTVDVEGADVVLASLQSLSMKTYDPAVLADFGFLVLDEVHHTGSPQLVAFIRNALAHDPFLTCFALRNMVFQVFGVLLSRQLVAVCIRKAGITKKKTRRKSVPARAAQENTSYQTNLQNFVTHYNKIRSSSHLPLIVAIDETGFNDCEVPLYGYSSRGKKLVVRHHRTTWKRTSVIAAITSQGGCETQLHDCPVNCKSFTDFLRSKNWPRGSVLLMDNVAFHKYMNVRDMVASKGWNLLFIPPYSP